jgi:hypothetical protein
MTSIPLLNSANKMRWALRPLVVAAACCACGWCEAQEAANELPFATKIATKSSSRASLVQNVGRYRISQPRTPLPAAHLRRHANQAKVKKELFLQPNQLPGLRVFKGSMFELPWTSKVGATAAAGATSAAGARRRAPSQR